MASLVADGSAGRIDAGGFLVESGKASGTENAAGRFRSRSLFGDPSLIASKRETADRLR